MEKDKLSVLFYDIMEECVADGLLVESAEQDFDSSFAVYEALEEIFIENYKPVTLEESILAVVTKAGDPNEELIEAITEALLDESVGSAVATAVHGIGSRIAAYKAGKAQAVANKRTAVQNRATAMAGAAAVKAKSAARKSSGGLVGTFKAAVAQGKAEKSKGIAKRAYAAGSEAREKSQAASAALAAKEQKRKDLAQKIDTKIGAAKQAFQSGTRKAASVLGKFIGRLA
jgi:hypothetical protein